MARALAPPRRARHARVALLLTPVLALGALLAPLTGTPFARGAPPEPPRTVLVAAQAKQPSVAVGKDGAIHVAMLRRGNVVVTSSKDGGRTFAAPTVAIDAQGSARGGAQRGPRLGSDAKGRLYVTAFVTFDAAELAKRYPAADLYLVTSTDGGSTWSKPVRVNEVEKKAPESLHSLAVSASGVAFAAWLDLRDRKGQGQDLWVARLDGEAVGPNRRLAEGICECCAPGLAVDAKGNPFLAWREGGDAESREVLSTWSTDAGKTFSKPARVNRGDTKEHG